MGTAGTVRYAYDAAGRTTLRQKPRLSRKPDNWRYTWNTRDQLTAVTTPDGTTWHYAYDALGRRTSKRRLAPDGSAAAAEETRFTYQGPTLIEETSTSTDWPGTRTLTWDHDESTLIPLAQTTRYTPESGTDTDTDTRFHAIITDLVGTPTHLIDESGTTAWHAHRTLWGTTTWPPDSTAYTPSLPGPIPRPGNGPPLQPPPPLRPGIRPLPDPGPTGPGPVPEPDGVCTQPTDVVRPAGAGASLRWLGQCLLHRV